MHALLYLDEFEYVTQNPNFDADFFGGLRALAIHNNLSLIPATRRELVDLCHSEEIKGSPFFNIFATVVLRPFTIEQSEDLLKRYTAGTGFDFTPQEINFITNLAKHPIDYATGIKILTICSIETYHILQKMGLNANTA